MRVICNNQNREIRQKNKCFNPSLSKHDEIFTCVRLLILDTIFKHELSNMELIKFK
jgi:hypothetical protein